MPNWIDNPRYQRIIQKIQALPQWQRAIFSSAGADKGFASNEMRNKVDAITAAVNKKSREQAVSSGQERLDLGRERLKLSSELSGLGLAARQRWSDKQDTYRKKMADERWDIDKKDRRLGEYLGYGNVALSGLLGYKEMERAKVLAEEEQAIRKKILGMGGITR